MAMPKQSYLPIAFEVTEDQAWALAQFLKRVCWEDVQTRTVGKRECRLAIEGMEEVRTALRRMGINPR